MAKLSGSIDVPLPPEVAWKHASDLSRFKEWLTIHRVWRSKLPDDIEKGTVVESIVEVKGMYNRIKWTVVRYKPPEGMTLDGDGVGGVKVKLMAKVQPERRRLRRRIRRAPGWSRAVRADRHDRCRRAAKRHQGIAAELRQGVHRPLTRDERRWPPSLIVRVRAHVAQAPGQSANLATMNRRPRPGWLVAFFALLISASAWMPWLTTAVNGGGWANAIGGAHGNLELPKGFGAGQLIVLLSSTLMVAGAMVGRGLSAKLASVAALVISLLLVALMVWYYKLNVKGLVSAEYGLYVGAVGAACAVACSIAAVIVALAAGRSNR